MNPGKGFPEGVHRFFSKLLAHIQSKVYVDRMGGAGSGDCCGPHMWSSQGSGKPFDVAMAQIWGSIIGKVVTVRLHDGKGRINHSFFSSTKYSKLVSVSCRSAAKSVLDFLASFAHECGHCFGNGMSNLHFRKSVKHGLGQLRHSPPNHRFGEGSFLGEFLEFSRIHSV